MTKAQLIAACPFDAAAGWYGTVAGAQGPCLHCVETRTRNIDILDYCYASANDPGKCVSCDVDNATCYRIPDDVRGIAQFIWNYGYLIGVLYLQQRAQVPGPGQATGGFTNAQSLVMGHALELLSRVSGKFHSAREADREPALVPGTVTKMDRLNQMYNLQQAQYLSLFLNQNLSGIHHPGGAVVTGGPGNFAGVTWNQVQDAANLQVVQTTDAEWGAVAEGMSDLLGYQNVTGLTAAQRGQYVAAGGTHGTFKGRTKRYPTLSAANPLPATMAQFATSKPAGVKRKKAKE
jgi:hypothetical protein